MNLLKISKYYSIPINNIDWIADYNHQMQNYVRDVKNNNYMEILKFTGGKKCNCVICLKSGKLILLNTSYETIINRIDNNSKSIKESGEADD